MRRYRAKPATGSAPEVQTCLILRHAVALPRSSWQGDDLVRPLSHRGERQAAALARELATEQVRRVLASPAQRCVATVVAIAENAELLVEIAPFLAEGSDGAIALKRLLAASESLDGPGVLAACTHGDVLVGLLDELIGWGAVADPPRAVQKGGAVRLQVVAGAVAAASIVPAPD
ncbi:MAG: phosphoglycerate mutase family protein [Acidimicrobiales bacterium]